MKFAQIILPLNLKGTFTYTIPEEFQTDLISGMRVLVSFHGKKIYTGIVAEMHDEKPESFIPKEIISILDETAILPPEQLSFWKWLSDYYLCNIGEIYRFAFPSSLKLESETYLKLRPGAVIDLEILDVHELFLIQALEVQSQINLTSIEAFIPKKEIIKTINALIDLQYIEIDEKVSEKYKVKEIAYVRIKDLDRVKADLSEILLDLKRSPKQQELLLLLLEKQTLEPYIPVRKSKIFEDGNFASAQLKKLVEKNLVEEYLLQHDRQKGFEGTTEEIQCLSDAQQRALTQIEVHFGNRKNVLLHGVTASGKTHIYLHLIENCIAAGKTVLFLLPEISLAKQIQQRLEKTYGSILRYYHQKMSDFERVEIWKRVRNKEVQILIGTRSSVFLPFSNLGLVIVDEEHDSAYRPREISPYFNAKDAGIVLAQLYGANCILGSATPSVESYYLAQKGKLAYVQLSERFGEVKLPKIELINFKEAIDSKRVSGNFSEVLLQNFRETLSANKQIMVLHNRRGFANVLECESCGYASYCSNCDVVMTFHKFSNELKCHYCGHKAAKPTVCPKCHSQNLNTRGVGVEQIYEELSLAFPDSVVDRMDVDSMRRKFAYEQLYEKIENGETDIIVGTQMISKGLDFENIELVAVPRADQMLFVQDFRAEERAFQLITQVSGRAGRVSGEGKVILQTFNTLHHLFQFLKEGNTDEIYKYFLNERKQFNYPPYSRIILIELRHRKEDKTNRASQYLSSILKKYLSDDIILGPEKAPIGKINLLYQFQILIKLPRGKNYNHQRNLVIKSLVEFEEIPAYKSIKKVVLVDF